VPWSLMTVVVWSLMFVGAGANLTGKIKVVGGAVVTNGLSLIIFVMLSDVKLQYLA